MKLKFKRLVSIGLMAALCSSVVFSGCSDTSSEASGGESSTASLSSSDIIELPEDGGFTTVEYTASDDKYRTYYEIFVYSFYDSDGDGIGDIQGVISKLDYLNDGDPTTTDDLGIEGIWLMPIMPSPSYHKYNISDYMAIDEDYGTMEDFEELLEECHERGIDVIIDLVINHTSRQHEWYQNAIAELKEGKTDGYAQYYHFEENKDEDGWSKAGVGDWYYECEFDTDMPDLNLTNEDVRAELEAVVKYWLDLGVDGFRLDAVKYYEDTGTDDSVEDLQWLYTYAQSVKEDVYMVGECWDGSNIISEYYNSGVDSFFNFDMQSATGRVTSAINNSNALSYVQYLENWQDTIQANNSNAIDATFISNHDTARSAGFLMTKLKEEMAAALYILTPGNSFIYYGEEIAMTGSSTDPDKRTGMYWSSTDDTGYVSSIPGSTNKTVPDQSVEEALEDSDSLLTFYKRVIALKNQNPEIARGDITAVDFGINEAAGYISEYEGSKVMVIFNVSDTAQTVSIPTDEFTVSEVRGYVIADSSESTTTSALDAIGTSSSEESEEEEVTEFTVTTTEVTLPAYSVIVLK